MPGGRPSPIDAIIGQRDDGTPITVADRIVASLRVATPLYQAAQAAGVDRDTLKAWLSTAGKLAIQHRGDFEHAKLTGHERRCIEFSAAVMEAQAAWLVDANSIHERIARGGLPQVITTVEVDADGKEVKRTTRTTQTLPSERALEWRIKHAFPAEYADRLELTGAGGGPIEVSQEERASALLELVSRFRKGKDEPEKKRRPRSRSAVGSQVPESEGDANGPDSAERPGP